jgi:hypothetical protein
MPRKLLPTPNPLKKENAGQVPVAHACNPSYSGGRDQGNCGSSQGK